MKSAPPSKSAPPARDLTVPAFLLTLAAVLCAIFARSFLPGEFLFSSDGPLGANAADYAQLPTAFRGMWQDLNWVGGYAGSAFPSLTYVFLWVLKPLFFAKFYAPLSLAVLGFSAWLLFRQLGFNGWVCALGGLAAALNSDFFSYACWGLGTHVLAVASTFLALAALVTPATPRSWLKGVLAGAAVGMAIMEGFDSGAILSLYVAAFAVFQAWIEPGNAARRLALGVGRTAVVAVAAAIVAAQALTILIGTQIQGVVGMQQDPKTREQRWEEATTWSLPKIETLRTVVPGLYGYRMDTPDGGNYRGRVGELPSRPELQPRHSGAGHYAGVLVVLLGAFAIAQAARRAGGAFTVAERRMVWFWTGAAAVSLALAWGRHAPFYQFFYALPYFSTIRNPVKFLHPFSLALVILFAYGAEALWRTQVARASALAGSLGARFKAWRAGASGFDTRWLLGLVFAVGVSLLAWLLYASQSRALQQELTVQILREQGGANSPEAAASAAAMARAMIGFSLAEVGWSVLLLALAVGLVVLACLGVFSGRNSKWAGVVFGALLLFDLGRANRPWINYWQFNDKYAANAVFDALRARPHEHRMALLPVQVNQELAVLRQVYQVDWLQHAFRYYNIQSLDVVQDPRPSVDNELYRAAFTGKNLTLYLRLWQLTNTRFILGLSGLADVLNQQVDPGQKRFRDYLPFGLAQSRSGGGIQVITNTVGPFALLEFTGALPRAQLFNRWEVPTNGTAALERLADLNFDPSRTLLLADAPRLSPTATNAPAGTVEIVDYRPKHIVLKAQAATPAMLLLNDKFDPQWTVTVDGRPEPLLRANFLMRAVQLEPGLHTVEFRFAVPPGPFVISLVALAGAAGCLVWVWRDSRRNVARAA